MEAQANTVIKGANGAAQASEEQLEALEKAKRIALEAAAATDGANSAYRYGVLKRIC